jgi:hypothetical protein
MMMVDHLPGCLQNPFSRRCAPGMLHSARQTQGVYGDALRRDAALTSTGDEAIRSTSQSDGPALSHPNRGAGLSAWNLGRPLMSGRSPTGGGGRGSWRGDARRDLRACVEEAVMPGHDDRRTRARSPLSRRGFLQSAVGTTGLLLLTACGGATAPAAPAKPTEAPKPAAAKPTEAPIASGRGLTGGRCLAGRCCISGGLASRVSRGGGCTAGRPRRSQAGQPLGCEPVLLAVGQLYPDGRRVPQEAD